MKSIHSFLRGKTFAILLNIFYDPCSNDKKLFCWLAIIRMALMRLVHLNGSNNYFHHKNLYRVLKITVIDNYKLEML